MIYFTAPKKIFICLYWKIQKCDADFLQYSLKYIFLKIKNFFSSGNQKVWNFTPKSAFLDLSFIHVIELISYLTKKKNLN